MHAQEDSPQSTASEHVTKDGDDMEWPDDISEAAAEARKRTEEAKRRLAAAQEEARKADSEIRHYSSIEKSLMHREKSRAHVPAPRQPPVAQKRRKHQEIEPQVRALIAEAVLDKDKTYEQAEKEFDVSHATVWRIVKEEKASRTGEASVTAPKKKRGRHSSFTPDSLVWLCSAIEQDSDVPLKELADGLRDNFDIDVGVSTISKTLRTQSITWKESLEIPSSWNEPATLEKRVEFIARRTCDEILSERPIFYIDETGADLKQARKSRGRALAGRSASLTLKPKSRRISLIGALSKSGMVHTQIVESLGPAKRGTTGDDLRLFIHNARPKLRGGIILIDTIKIHDTKELAKLWSELKAQDNIDVIILPPYSSFMSAIEYAFNKMKMILKEMKPQTHAELKDAMLRASEQITANDAEGFFRKAHSYWRQAALGLPFQGKILDPELATLAPAATGAVQNATA